MMNQCHRRLFHFARPSWVWAWLIPMLVISCSIYKRKPLTPEAVEKAITPPDTETVRVRAANIHHPVLKPIVFDNRDGLSPDEAAILAVIANPSLKAERDQLALSDAQLLQAGLLPNPQLSLSADIPTGGLTAGANTAYGIGLDWEITALLRRPAEIKSAKAARKEIDLAIAWRELQTAEASRIAVYRVVALKRQIELQKEILQRLESNLSAVEQAAGHGLMSEADLSVIKTARDEARAGLLEKEKQMEEELFLLKQLVGVPAGGELVIQEGIELPDRIELPAPETLSADLENRRLDLLALQQGYESQEQTLRAAVLAQFPRINLGVTHARDNTDLYTVGFGLSLELPIFDQNQGKIGLERATRQQLFDEYADRVFQARSDIAQLAAAIDSINLQIEQARQALPELERLTQSYQKAVELGHADILTYYYAYNTLAQKQMDLIALQENLVEAEIALALANGEYQTGTFATRPAPNDLKSSGQTINNDRGKK